MDEHELVRQAKRGDTAAFEALVQRYWAKAYRLAESLVGAQDAADVTVDAFARAWQGLPRFREQASFGTWLFRILVNCAKEWQRKRATAPVEPLEEVDTEDEEGVSLRDIEAIACERDRQRFVRQAVQQLPDHLRLPLVLRFWDELTYAEIAQVLGIKESTARMRVAAALKMLAETLASVERSGRRRTP